MLLGEHRIPVHVFRGAVVMVAGDLDAPLEYTTGRLAELITADWKKELHKGEHFRVLEGAELREFKAFAALTPATGVSANTKHLTILTEAGIDRILLLTRKPAGVRLRAFVADELLPRLRRGQPIPPVSAPLPEAGRRPRRAAEVPAGPQLSLPPRLTAAVPPPAGSATALGTSAPKFHPALVERIEEQDRAIGGLELPDPHRAARAMNSRAKSGAGAAGGAEAVGAGVGAGAGGGGGGLSPAPLALALGHGLHRRFSQ